MDTKPIIEYNKDALINIGKLVEFSGFTSEPITKQITFDSFSSLAYSVKSILTAIEIIGETDNHNVKYSGNETALSICRLLAKTANKLMPTNELEFLDELLVIKETLSGKKFEFTPLNK